jgi:DNA replication licensing factor MCM6
MRGDRLKLQCYFSSIAKAGVRATLKARTSILAAANPINGRYDPSKPLQENVMLSAPIMSRFDLFFVLIDECDELVDYAVARKILDVHTNAIQITTDEVYQRDDILTYISFARHFKPLITHESGKLLIENYSHLRQCDVGPGGKPMCSITIRQLESMIRLSEAMAKMECSEEVLPRHVNEAYRLLNKSIIRLQQRPDAQSGPEKIANENEQFSEPVTVRKTISLTADEYKNLANMLILHLREEVSMKKSALVRWYLGVMEGEDDLIERKLLVERLIDRLITHDCVLIPIELADETMDEDDPVLVVHKNYLIE